MVPGDQPGGSGFRIWCGTFGFDAGRRVKAERPVRQIHVMAAEIRERSTAEGPPMAPVERNIARMVWTWFNGPQPEIVMKRFWNRRGVCRPSLAAESSGNPNMNFLNSADRFLLDQFNHAAVIVAGMNLGAHLRGLARFLRGFADGATF